MYVTISVSKSKGRGI